MTVYTATITQPRQRPAPNDEAADFRPTLQMAQIALEAKIPAARGKKRSWDGNWVKWNDAI
jgi:hypothetical protein